MSQAQVLFSRYEDGTKPVKVLSDGWEVLGGGSQEPPQRYTTVKSLLAALTGHPEGRHWSVDRYFRLGPVHGSPSSSQDILDLLANLPFGTPIICTTPGITIPADHVASEATWRKNQSREMGPALVLGLKLGIDLSKRAHEVRKLLFAGFGRRMFQHGYDPEDVLQEVYKGLLIRNSGKCPWDERKSSFGHYVHMVISCVLSNYHRKQRRVQEMEQVGLAVRTRNAEGMRYNDVASNTTFPAQLPTIAVDSLVWEEAEDLVDYMQDFTVPDSLVVTKLIPLVLTGTPRDQLAPCLGVSNASVSRALVHLRKQARAWKSENAVSAF